MSISETVSLPGLSGLPVKDKITMCWKGYIYGGTAPSTPKLACFVLYLKIINVFLKNNTCIFNSKLPKELQYNIKI